MNNCETCVYRCDQINTEKENELLKEQVKQLREQLEKEIKELKTKLEKQSKVLNSGYAELDKEHELELKAIREQLIKELKNWLPRGLQRIDIEVLLEKLEELEK